MIAIKINFPSTPKSMALVILIVSIFYYNLDYNLISSNIVSGLYIEFSNVIIILIGVYLILVLISIVKIAAALAGPIKSFFRNEK